MRMTKTVRGLLSHCRLIVVAWLLLGAAPAAGAAAADLAAPLEGTSACVLTGLLLPAAAGGCRAGLLPSAAAAAAAAAAATASAPDPLRARLLALPCLLAGRPAGLGWGAPALLCCCCCCSGLFVVSLLARPARSVAPCKLLSRLVMESWLLSAVVLAWRLPATQANRVLVERGLLLVAVTAQ